MREELSHWMIILGIRWALIHEDISQTLRHVLEVNSSRNPFLYLVFVCSDRYCQQININFSEFSLFLFCFSSAVLLCLLFLFWYFTSRTISENRHNSSLIFLCVCCVHSLRSLRRLRHRFTCEVKLNCFRSRTTLWDKNYEVLFLKEWNFFKKLFLQNVIWSAFLSDSHFISD